MLDKMLDAIFEKAKAFHGKDVRMASVIECVNCGRTIRLEIDPDTLVVNRAFCPEDN
jgi:hypothetical protein